MLPSYEEVSSDISALDSWEQLRQHRNRSIVRRGLNWLVGMGIIAIGVAFVYWAVTDFGSYGGTEEDSEGALYLALFGILVAICAPLYIRSAVRKTHKKYSRYYKELIVPPMISNMVKLASYPSDSQSGSFACHYDADGRIPLSKLAEIPLFESLSKANLYDGEDYFNGTLGQTDFELCEIHAQEETSDGEGGKTKSPLFQGLVLLADFHKSFEGTTVIQSRKGRASGYLSFKGTDMKTISHEFDALFRVKTTDEMTTRYLLPIDMLERLTELRKRYPKNKVSVCLHNGLLAIAIHNIDFFEAKGIKRLENDGILNTYNEIQSILGIVDLLNLNTRIWNKQASQETLSKSGSSQRG